VFILTEALRALHRILTDSQGYVNLSEQRKAKLGTYIDASYNSLKILKIPLKKIKDYLKLNAKLNPDYPELKNYDFIAREIAYGFERRFEEYPAFPMAKFYEGTEGLKEVANEILKEKGVKVDAFLSSKLMNFIPFFSEYFRKLRKERNIFLRAITDKAPIIEERKIKDIEELRKIKYLDEITKDLESAIYIYKNKIAVITATERERGGIIIENKEFAEILRRMFSRYWEFAEK
jgi:hypothetical protein